MTDTGNGDAIRRRIRGLLAKAEATDNDLEADAFSAKAFEMMERYRVDLAEVTDAAASFVRTTYDLATRAKYLRPSLSLLGVVAKHYAVVVLVPSTGNSKNPSMVGDATDIEATVMMFESLLIQRDRAILRAAVPYGSNAARFRHSAALGFAGRIHTRLKAMRVQRVEVATSGAALALVDRLSDVMASLDNPASRHTNRAQTDGAGVGAGFDAADRADLGQDRLSHTTGPRALNR